MVLDQVKGGLATLVAEMDGPALLAAADYAEERGEGDAAQLRQIGAALLAAPPTLLEKASRYARKATCARLLSERRYVQSAPRLAAGGLEAGWFTTLHMAWKGLGKRDRAAMAARVAKEERGTGEQVRPLALSEVIKRTQAKRRGPVQFGRFIVGDNNPGAKYDIDCVEVTADDGTNAAVALERLLILLARFPGAQWRWAGGTEPLTLEQGGEMVALVMPVA